MGNKKMMDTLFYSQLDNPNIKKVEEDIKLHNPSKIVLFCETEWDSKELCPEWAEVLNNYNVELLLTLCSFPNEYYKEKTKYFKSVRIIHWPTYWINWTLMCSNNLNFDITYENFKYPFICLNNKNHLHRCMLIDQLTRNNLLDKGVVSWQRFPHQQPSDHIYKFKFYDDAVRLLNDEFETKLDSFLIPPQYHESFLHVVGEATTNVTCISEKTWLPILYKKPWIIMSNQYFHQRLVDLGFELYDEIIDYSFDSDPNMESRAYAISENVKRITQQNINDLYKLIKPKTDKNFDNFYRIIKSRDCIPDIIIERVNMIVNNVGTPTYTDPRYVHVCKLANIL